MRRTAAAGGHVRKVMWGSGWLGLAFAAWYLVFFARTAIPSLTSDDSLSTVDRVDCAAAMTYVGAVMPERASDEDCTSYTFLDQSYDGSFRMPRRDVEEWLATSFPGAGRSPCEEDLCAHVGDGMDDTKVYSVHVSVRYEGESAWGPALVTFHTRDY